MAIDASVDTEFVKMSDQDLIIGWEKTQGILNTYKLKEAAMRKEIVRRKFENAPIGTTNIELGKGYLLKCVKKVTYNLKADTCKLALDAIAKLGNEGTFIAQRLVKWKPDLSVTEYKNLNKDIKAIIDGVLTISDAMPTLEIVEPKKK